MTENPAIDAKARLDALAVLNRETPSGNVRLRAAAQELVREAKTSPAIAEQINAVADPATRAALIQARDHEQAQAAEIKSPKAYIATAARVVADIENPSRRAQAEAALNQLALKLGEQPMRERSREHGPEQDFEAGR